MIGGTNSTPSTPAATQSEHRAPISQNSERNPVPSGDLPRDEKYKLHRAELQAAPNTCHHGPMHHLCVRLGGLL